MMTGKKAKALALWSALIALLLMAFAGLMMIRHGFSARDKPSHIETLVASTARAMAVPARAKNMKNPIPNIAESLAEARAHWADHCATCHANNGSGETSIGQNLYPKAPDLRSPATQRLSDGELYYTIHNGIRLTGMPAWGTDEKDEDSWKLVLFVRHSPQLTPEEENEMKRLNRKSPEELKEEQEEEQFLNGTEPSGQAGKPTHHK